MIRVIVIDDEPVIARSVKNSIEMCDQEFQVVAVANDGQTGLKLVKEMQPDLLFVDICMPVLGGLDLLQRLKEEGFEIPAVILSGYQEFEYAKRSITLGVLDYLVKPLNPLNLKAFLMQLKSMLSAGQYEKQRLLLERLLHSSESVPEDNMTFQDKCYFRMAKIILDAFNFIRNNQFAVPSVYAKKEFLQCMCEGCFGKQGYWLVEGKYENEYILVLKEEAKTLDQITKMYEELKENLSPRHYVTFVLSDTPVELGGLKQMLMKLEGCIYYNSIYGKSELIIAEESLVEKEYREGNADNCFPDTEYLKKMMEQNKREALTRAVEEILDICRRKDYTQSKLIGVLRAIMRNCCTGEPETEIDFMINLMLVHSSDYESLCKRVTETLQDYIKTKENTEAGSEYVIYRIKDYLDAHYREKIVIQEIADKFGLNYSYMCSLFRKYTHVSPNEYLIMKKMEQAKVLLETNRDLNIKDIAELVGYTDQYYFSRLFKTYEKVSPKEYRKNKA
ncbi:MAG: response regulator [Faecalicatena sp.]|uniref:response regulator transcription factor n=1 Tax=Faecalicatena sp. TaxID=2005360 RepID=UPI00258BA96E|nr:response regulator [Faecalicatena sp.]MCI6464486.1 response regulator [Faecalicatena sp.]MDY5619048.1 response regulator [Lachnospiraceae bacterium]